MKPYPDYKPSGVAWLGDVPGHWCVKKIKHVASLQSGEGITSEAIEDVGEYAVYGGNGRRGYTDKATHLGEFVLIGRQGALCGNVHYVSGEFWASEHAVVSSFYAGDSPKWAAYMFEFMNLGQYSVSAAQPGLAVERIQLLTLVIPPLDEQQAIADYLDTETARIDALIREKLGLVGLLGEARQSFVSELLSGEDLPGTPTGNEWVPHLPHGWELRRLKHLAKVRSGIAKGKDTEGQETVELPYLRVANMQDGHLDLTEVSTIEVDAGDAVRYLLQPGDVLMNEGGDYDKLGRGALWSGEVSPCLHQNHVFAVRPFELEISEWLASVTLTRYAKFYFMNNAKQSTNLASISQTNVKELPVLLPPPAMRIELLQRVKREADSLDALIHHAKAEIALLQELRAATIADAVLGRVDVRSA